MGNQIDKKDQDSANEMPVVDTTHFTVIKPFNEEKVNEHAAKCGGRRNLREVPISTDTDEIFIYLVKKPGRNLMQAIAVEENKKDKKDITAVQNMLMGCVLEGDREALDNDGAIYSELLKAIGSLVRSAKGDVKKL